MNTFLLLALAVALVLACGALLAAWVLLDARRAQIAQLRRQLEAERERADCYQAACLAALQTRVRVTITQVTITKAPFTRVTITRTTCPAPRKRRWAP